LEKNHHARQIFNPWLKTAVSCATVYAALSGLSQIASGLPVMAAVYAAILCGLVFAASGSAVAAIAGPSIFLLMIAGVEVSLAPVLGIAFIGLVAYVIFVVRAGLPVWLAVAVCLSVFIAYFGGSQGGGGGMVQFLMQNWKLSEADARQATFIFRKLVHINFYGLCALAWYLASLRKPFTTVGKALPFAFGATFCLAAFDETRQLFAENRTGTPVDVWIDMGGAILFLAIAYFVTRRPTNAERAA
jgi:VanZ family protein